MSPWAWMSGSSCDTESPDVPPIARGATSAAPNNSTCNRTIDRQCMVTRLGLSPVASAMSVDLLIAVLHHPLGADAPDPIPDWRVEGGERKGKEHYPLACVMGGTGPFHHHRWDPPLTISGGHSSPTPR